MFSSWRLCLAGSSNKVVSFQGKWRWPDSMNIPRLRSPTPSAYPYKSMPRFRTVTRVTFSERVTIQRFSRTHSFARQHTRMKRWGGEKYGGENKSLQNIAKQDPDRAKQNRWARAVIKLCQPPTDTFSLLWKYLTTSRYGGIHRHPMILWYFAKSASLSNEFPIFLWACLLRSARYNMSNELSEKWEITKGGGLKPEGSEARGRPKRARSGAGWRGMV